MCDGINLQMHVVVSREFLLAVEKNILSSRPSWRVDAAKVNTECDSALLMSDHSFFPRGRHSHFFYVHAKLRLLRCFCISLA